MPTTQWSPLAASCWGKTDPETGRSLPLVRHLEDAAAVAEALWENSPTAIGSGLSRSFGSAESAKRFVTFCAGIHDLGKASQHFAFKAHAVGMPHLAEDMVRHGLDVPTRIAKPLPHGVLGQAHLEGWLRSRPGADPRRAIRLAGIVGGHHGRNPTAADVQAARYVLDSEGGNWHAVRDEILHQMATATGADQFLDSWLAVDIPITTQVLTTALVIMADWIASDESLFPYEEPAATADRLATAMGALRLPAPWSPGHTPQDPGELFAARFPGLAGAVPNATQEATLRQAYELDEPGLIVLEAPMGLGKTEAAFLAAEVLARRFGMGGVFFGLPTMATSNPMFSRVLSWLDQVPTQADTSVALAHSKAGLNEEYAGMMPWARPRSVFDEADADPVLAESRAMVHAWFTGRKRAILAHHVVGTIDQALFAGLKAKHVVLRHLGLASKVVILDEVHAADEYMRTYLKRVLTWLGAYHTPVILMSATLPPGQRAELIAAYQEGRGGAAEPTLAPTDGYPRVTAVGAGVEAVKVPATSGATTVRLRQLSDDPDALVSCLSELLEGGGCAGVIHNTVARAQATNRLLSQRLDCEVLLVHSRFLAPHRAAREADLVERLGRGASRRPHRLVVVGTQVLEQSLDIDFDVMVADLAPVDLTLQRIGRLHRHDRARPPALAEPMCFLTGVEDWSAEPPTFPRGPRFVYGHDALLRAAAVLGELDRITLPADIPALVARAYEPRPPVPARWQAAAKQATIQARRASDERHRRAASFLMPDPTTTSNLNGLIEGAAGDPDDTRSYQQVRDGEDSLEVVVVIKDGGQVRLPDRIGEFSSAPMPLFGPPENNVARAAAACTLALPHSLSGAWIIEQIINELETFDVSSWQTSPWLKGQLALVLDNSGRTELAGHMIRYDFDTGLIVEAQEGR
ncbi:MAG: CRISPR-associated helicase Cas3' [Arachnia sp.]